MKAAVVLALVASAAAQVDIGDACAIPAKYAARNGEACQGEATGYIVNMFCKSAYETTLNGVLPETRTFRLTAATAPQWSSAGPAVAVEGCAVPSNSIAADGTGFVQPRLAVAMGCAAGDAPFLNAVADSIIKGATITCDMTNQYYPTAGMEGSAMCQSGTSGAAPLAWAAAPPVPASAYWQTGFGNEHNVAMWAGEELTCSSACTIPEPLCYGNGVAHGNVVFDGPSMIAGACRMKPTNGADVSRLTFYCKSNPHNTYVARCNANADNTVSNGLTWEGGLSPPCGGADGVSTGFYTLSQGTPQQQLADTIPNFPTVTSTISTAVTSAVAGQWGGIQRVYEPFVEGSTYNVAVNGCAGNANRNDCVQKTVNWWRCEGLTIDASGVCYANGVRIACPTHTNNHRCPSSSSKKGLLGLLGLVGILPLLLLCLLCCCCLLPLLFRRKKTEGDVHFATFDAQAAPIGGSIAPATACYAPSIGAVPPMMGAPVANVF